jgi:signal transduction histidine kinase
MTTPAPLAPTIRTPGAVAPVGRVAVVAVLYLSIVLATAILPFVSPLRNHLDVSIPEQVARAAESLMWLAVLLASVARQPTGRLWLLIFALMVAQRIEILAFVPDSLVWSLSWVLSGFWVAVYTHLLVAFPTGQLRDRFDRVGVAWVYALMAGWSLNLLLFTGDWTVACIPECVRFLFVVWPNLELNDWLRNALTVVAAATLFPFVLIAIWRHWRAAGVAARRTLLPLLACVPLLLVVGVADILSGELDVRPGIDFFASPAGTVVRLAPQVILPAGLLLGILRSRWSRGRVATLIVDLGRGVPVGSLRDVLARTLGDPTLQLAFAAPGGGGFVDSSGQPIELPVDDPTRTTTRLERDGQLLGILVHDPMIELEDPGLVDAVGNAARLALENERLAAEVRAQLEEVRASRSRIVEAADAERRRVERDLHDGAQQRLVALAMRLQLSRETSPGVASLIDEATAELNAAIAEVRDLARGLHPTILIESGLGAAVESLVERIPVVVTVDVPETRFDAQVEATAYFVVAEALTNVVRHAAATEARVSIRPAEGHLVVTVADDGRGGADAAAGTGLRGLEDRVAAVGGHLTVESRAGRGTTVRAELPLDIPPVARPSGLTVEPRFHHEPAARISPPTTLRPALAERPTRGRLLSNPAALFVGVTGLVVIAALAAAGLGAQGAALQRGVAASFARPFYYDVRSDSGIRLSAGPLNPDRPERSDRLHVLSPYPRYSEGISIWLVDEVLADVCDSKGPTAPRQPGVEGLLAHLRSIDRLQIAELPAMTVDGHPATRLDLSVAGSGSGCAQQQALLLWRDAASTQAMWVPDRARVRVILLDVDRATVVFEIWNQQDLASWLPGAEEIIDSIRFFSRPPGDATPSPRIPG